MNIPKVSVIVLIYKVEKYIERCARSLFCQTMQDIEYVFVNDCTPDCSIQILQSVIDEYPQRKSDIKIISHEKNMGSGVARNYGAQNETYIEGWEKKTSKLLIYKRLCKI